jgi:general secretion pathway protein B
VTAQSPTSAPPANPAAAPSVAPAPTPTPAAASTPNTVAPPTPAPAPAASGAAAARHASAAAAPSRTAKAAATKPNASQAAQPSAPPPAAEPKLRTLAELPDDLRRSVPQLAFGGSVYSDVPTQRMVIFNGQVMREGDPVTDELTLEQIRPRSAVMRLRGQRFEIAF